MYIVCSNDPLYYMYFGWQPTDFMAYMYMYVLNLLQVQNMLTIPPRLYPCICISMCVVPNTEFLFLPNRKRGK